jgi:CheY-like chemotaxis protein
MNAHASLRSPVDVLIAEDDASTRLGLRLLLEQDGYTCEEAEDGCAAVALAKERRPQCVFLDLYMPGLNGFDVARALRADARTRGARIHCLTGSRDPNAREDALRAGCELFLQKPVDATLLLQVVHEQVKHGKLESRSGLSKGDAEQLLDWLEANDCAIQESAFDSDGGYTVRWRTPPASS